MRNLSVIAAALLCLVLTASPAFAGALTGESTSYLRYRETMDGSHQLPLYEYLDFKIDGLNSSGASFHFGGWGRIDFEDKTLDKQFEGDIRYAYLSCMRYTANTTFKLGRIPVFEGIANEIIDGLFARTDLKAGFGYSVFIGRPVETDFFKDNGDKIFGTRLQHEVRGIYRLGVSYLREWGNEDSREEEAIDLWLRPLDKASLTGRSSFNTQSSGWMEHDYRLNLGPFSNLTMNFSTSRINYKDYFKASTSSAFKFEPDIINPDEKAVIFGAGIGYSMSQNIVFSGDYKLYNYHIAGNADYYGGRISCQLFKTSRVGFGYHRMSGPADRLRYSEFKGFVSDKRGPADVTIDVFVVNYDKAVNDVRTATSVSAGAGYELSPAVRFGADFEYSHDPFFDHDWRGSLKLVYNFGNGEPKR